jgi:hypothetical protein
MGNKVVVVDGAYSDLQVMESILRSAGRDVVTDLDGGEATKGNAIARGPGGSGVELLLTCDASTVQAIIDQFAAIPGVAYVLVHPARFTLASAG